MNNVNDTKFIKPYSCFATADDEKDIIVVKEKMMWVSLL